MTSLEAYKSICKYAIQAGNGIFTISENDLKQNGKKEEINMISNLISDNYIQKGPGDILILLKGKID